jgi:hypothetical protein
VLAQGIRAEQTDTERRTLEGRNLLRACGVGIAFGVLPYLFEMVPSAYRVDGVFSLATQAVSSAEICGVFLVAARRRIGWPSPLAAIGLGFGAIAIGRAIEGVLFQGLVGYSPRLLIFRMALALIGSGYIAFAIAAAIVAARTKQRSASQLPDEGIRSPEVESLWAR